MAIINSIVTGVDTSDSTSTDKDIIENKTAYVNDKKITGIMANHQTSTSTLNAGESYIITKGYHTGYDKITANSLKIQTSATARAYDILSNTTAFANGRKIAGKMTNQKPKTILLDIGDIYIIPEGYHSGNGKITAKPLASKTPGTAENNDILNDKVAWSNGNKLIGTMPNMDTMSKILKTGESYTIPVGYHDGTSNISAELSDSQINCTATPDDILYNKTACVNGNRISGTMPNQRSILKTLNNGESYTIPKGYHDSNGKVTANSLANQTLATAKSNDILDSKTAYINGTKVIGTMINQGAIFQTLDYGESYTIPEGYHDGTGTIIANLPDSEKDGTAVADDILEGQVAFVNGNKIIGTMTNNGSIIQSLNAGNSYTILKGYHDGYGKVNANSLSSQTSANATSDDILNGETAYINGNKITGTMNNNRTNNISLTAGNSYTIPKGYHDGTSKITTDFSSDQMNNTATSNEILHGKIACINGVRTTGIMLNNGAITQYLNPSGTYTIPVGYHNGSGKIIANSISNQMSATAEPHEILNRETAWVNGNKITGTMLNQGAISQTLNGGENYTIPAGYHNGSGIVTVNIPDDQAGCTATSDDILEGKVAFANCNRITGRIRLEPAKEDVARWISGTTLHDTSSASWQSVCYGNGRFVVVGHARDTTAYSYDGINWTYPTLPNEAYLTSVCYGNGKFVAVNSSSNTASVCSTDGINWVEITLPSLGNWHYVYYGNGKFIAVAGYSNTSDTAAYSTDGINWTATKLPSKSYWHSVCYGNGKFVAISGGAKSPTNKAAYSIDGINWIGTTLPSNANWDSVCYGNEKFVVVCNRTILSSGSGANSKKSAYSTDGINWTANELPKASCWYICYSNGKFIATTHATTNTVAYSTDGIKWVSTTMPSNGGWSQASYGNGKFISIKTSGESAYTGTLYRKVLI